jgi:hypothetical protein
LKHYFSPYIKIKLHQQANSPACWRDLSIS